MKIVSDSITINEVRDMATDLFGHLVKAVVDVDRKIVALNAELHSDLESLLLQDGSCQQHLWGVNIYPDETADEFVEFDSMINVRPSQNNRGRGVESKEVRDRILAIIEERIAR
mgnify:CR=1 FL=1